MTNKNTACVYMIRNIINEKRYFGSSLRWGSRLSAHRSQLRRGDHYNTLLSQEWLEFGDAAFEFVVIAEGLNLLNAKHIENEMIERFNTTDTRFGYNVMMRGRWSTSARLRNTEKKLIAKLKYALIPGVSLDDPMSLVFVQTGMKGHHT